MSQPTIKVSDAIADFLQAKGIRHVFGIIGSGNAHIFDSIGEKGYTQVICVHHEQAAVMAMATYYRTCGQYAAALVTTGAGSANAVTGVVSCWMDSIPGLILSGNENSKFTQESNPLRIWGIQGYDSTAMVSKVTKVAERVLDPEQIQPTLERAFGEMISGRPGPVWVDIPLNIQAAQVTKQSIATSQPWVPAPAGLPATEKVIETDPMTAAKQVFERLQRSQRPLLWLGHGIRLGGGVKLIEKLLAQWPVPSLVTWSGIDMIDSDHPLVYGRAGVYGQRCGNFVLQNCDYLLTIGTRLAVPQVGYDLTELARDADIAAVDIDAQELLKLDRVGTRYCMDAKAFLEAMIEVGGQSKTRPDISAWKAYCDGVRERLPWVGPEHADKGGFINSYRFMERLNQQFKPDQVVVTDMGTALLSGHQVLKTKEGQRLMTSLGLGEMGFGLPGAIGASIARGNKEVMCLNCDGGMMMNLQELQTMVHHRLPIKLFIFNNDGYLMIKHTQRALFKGRHHGVDLKSGVSCPDYSQLAKAMDIPAFQIRTWEDFDRVMPLVQGAEGPVICEVFMHPEQPLVPKLSLAPQKDGSIVSPPLEDLSPILPREEFRKNMLIPVHPKSETLGA